MSFARHPVLLLAVLALACGAAVDEAPMRVERGNLIYDGFPQGAPPTTPSLARWQNSRGASFVGWLADGSLLVSMRTANTAQLQRVAKPLALPETITNDVEPVTSAATHPYDAAVLVYRKDHGGDENMQLWLHDPSRGADRLLTDGRSRFGPPVFAHDGRRIAYSGNARDASSNDLYLSDIASDAAPRLLLAGGSAALQVEDWSQDDTRLAVIRYRSITDSQLLLVDVASGEQTPIEPVPPDVKGRHRSDVAGPVSIGEARFARGGRGLYFTSDRGGEFMALYYLDLGTHQLERLTPDTRWDVERFAISPDGRFLAYTLNESGLSRLVLRDLAMHADVLLPPLPAGAVIDELAFDHRSDRLAIALQSAVSPPQVFVLDVTASEPDAPPTVALAPLDAG